MSRTSVRVAASLFWLLSSCLATAVLGQQYPNVQVNISPTNPEETSIAINPLDVDNIVGVAQVPPSFYPSTDRGVTWSEGFLSDPFALGDPSVIFDRSGTAYYGYIGTFSHSGIFVNKSTDGGFTWNQFGTAVIEHEGAIPFEDKCYPTCDWTYGPHHGNVYIAWTQFDRYGSSNTADSTRILFARSTDGAESFSSPVRVSDQGGNAVDSDDTVEGAVPAVGPDGTVYLTWSGPRGIEFDRSTDGGVTFGSDQVISDQPGGWDFDVPGIFRCNGFPITKADISGGPYRGRVHVCWSDQRNGDTDVFLIYSDDDGATWSPRIRVNDDTVGNGRDQFFPWMDVDPASGLVNIVFYDRREHPDNLTTDVYLAVSDDGGESFLNEKISVESFVPSPSVFFGDYIGISAYAGWVRPLWARMDGTATSIWTALIDPDPSGAPVDLTTLRLKLTVSPNPVRSTTRILYRGPEVGTLPLTVHDALGRAVRHLDVTPSVGELSIVWDGLSDAGGEVASGVYFVRAGRRISTRFVVIR